MSTRMEYGATMPQELDTFVFADKVDGLLSGVIAASTGGEVRFRVNRDIIFAPEFSKIIAAQDRNSEMRDLTGCDVCNSSSQFFASAGSYLSSANVVYDTSCVLCNAGCNTVCNTYQPFPFLHRSEEQDGADSGLPSCLVMQV